jgi:A/G-specific adenine glycosylase
MLQQTSVATVIPYFERFTARWPCLCDLAKASQDDILAAWSGLGYYARARKLHACAQHVAVELQGRFPETAAGLQTLPGIGPYTAAAIAAIAFGQPSVAVDGNVERLLARLFAIQEPLPGSKVRLRRLASTLIQPLRPGDYVQALIELGATLCTPRSPNCEACPWASSCAARMQGTALQIPAKLPKKPRPLRQGCAFLLERPDGAVWLQKSPEGGLLGGLLMPPVTPWREKPWNKAEALRFAPKGLVWRNAGAVRHVFSHFALDIVVYRALSGRDSPNDGHWADANGLKDLALSTLARKILALTSPGKPRARRAR